jgi:5-formyltetrahydrofolate cyclo-ligase
LQEKRLLLSEIRDFPGELSQGSFGILEPKAEFIRPVSPEELEIVVVPGVAFDYEGTRIGYGGGFYDRFLKEVKDATIIGLAYECQILPKLPRKDHDVRVDKIITPKCIIETSTPSITP